MRRRPSGSLRWRVIVTVNRRAASAVAIPGAPAFIDNLLVRPTSRHHPLTEAKQQQCQLWWKYLSGESSHSLTTSQFDNLGAIVRPRDRRFAMIDRLVDEITSKLAENTSIGFADMG